MDNKAVLCDLFKGKVPLNILESCMDLTFEDFKKKNPSAIKRSVECEVKDGFVGYKMEIDF